MHWSTNCLHDAINLCVEIKVQLSTKSYHFQRYRSKYQHQFISVLFTITETEKSYSFFFQFLWWRQNRNTDKWHILSQWRTKNRLRWRWRPGVVDWGGVVFASCCRGSSCSLARAMNGLISAAALLALADQLPLPMIVKRGWSGFHVRRAI